MATTIYSPKDIYEQEFKVSMRGFDRAEVDEFLDNVINDYELFLAEIQALKAENARLKADARVAAERVPETTSVYSTPLSPISDTTTYTLPGFEAPSSVPSSDLGSNFDILKRISRLEKEVFGKQITE